MLWVDNPEFVSAEELMILDPELLDVCETEKLQVSGERGLIRLGIMAAERSLYPWLDLTNVDRRDLSLRNLNRPLWIGSETNRSYVDWSQIVVSGDYDGHLSSLKLWVMDKVLEYIYTSLSNRNGDRYQSRLDGVRERLTNESWPHFRSAGVPIVVNPLTAPGAPYVRGGLFLNSNLSAVAGSGTYAGNVQVAVVWANEDSDNNVSYLSAARLVTLSNATVLNVSIANLTVPNGTQPSHLAARSSFSPGVATGWHVYAGVSGEPMYRQNASVIPVATKTWTATGNLLSSGETPGLGQFPDFFLAMETKVTRA